MLTPISSPSHSHLADSHLVYVRKWRLKSNAYWTKTSLKKSTSQPDGFHLQWSPPKKDQSQIRLNVDMRVTNPAIYPVDTPSTPRLTMWFMNLAAEW